MPVEEYIVTDTIWLPDLKQADGPKYRAIEVAIRQAVRGGTLKCGDKLPPVRDLAWQAKVTPGTVARAYKNLVDAGFLDAAVGRGTFVPEQKVVQFEEVTDMGATLLSPRLPDLGQTDLIRDGFHRYADTAASELLLRYPVRQNHRDAHLAFYEASKDFPIGKFSPDNVVITHGGQHSIVMIFQTVLKGSSPVVMVDELTYAGFRRAAELCRAPTVSVEWDEEGPRLDKFERLVIDHGVQIYATCSDVMNPTAMTTSLKRRQEIAEMCRRYGVHIIDDDSYRNGPFIGPSYRQYVPELAWYTTSPSKSISAALRIGFVVPPEGHLNAFIRSVTFNSFGVPTAITSVYAYVQNHPEMPAILKSTRAHMADRMRMALNVLGGYKVRWQENVPFIWLELPDGWRSGEFCRSSEAQGIFLKSAEEFGPRDGRRVQAVRIALNGGIAIERFETALRGLRDLLDHPPERITV